MKNSTNHVLGFYKLIVLLFLLMPAWLFAKDPRVELAEAISLAELWKHIRNPDIFLDAPSNVDYGDIVSSQSAKSLIVGKRHVILERYFGMSNGGFKSYVNLDTRRAYIFAYGLYCSHLNWSQIDKMVSEADLWFDGYHLGNLPEKVLDFILPEDYRILVCMSNNRVDLEREFSDIKYIGTNSITDSSKCEGNSSFYVFNPYLNMNKSDTTYLEVQAKWLRRGKRLRFFLPHAKRPIFGITRPNPGPRFGRWPIYDWK